MNAVCAPGQEMPYNAAPAATHEKTSSVPWPHSVLGSLARAGIAGSDSVNVARSHSASRQRHRRLCPHQPQPVLPVGKVPRVSHRGTLRRGGHHPTGRARHRGVGGSDHVHHPVPRASLIDQNRIGLGLTELASRRDDQPRVRGVPGSTAALALTSHREAEARGAATT